MSDKTENSKETQNLLLSLLKDIEDLKTFVYPLLKGQDSARNMVKKHTETLTDLLETMVVVRKDEYIIFSELKKTKDSLTTQWEFCHELDSRIKKLELQSLLAIYEKAKAVIKIGDSELQKLEILSKKNPENTDLWFIIGIVYHTKKQYDKALQCFDNITEINAKDGHAWCWKGIAQATLRKKEEAVKSFEIAFKLTNCQAIFYFQANLMYDLGKKESALELIDKSIQANPKNAMSWAFKGHILMGLDKNLEALGCFEKSLEFDPDLAVALEERGMILFKFGPNYEEKAYASFDKVTKLRPKYYTSWVYKGRILGSLGKYEEAIKSYDKAIELNPKNPCIYCLKSMLESSLKQYSKAIGNLNEALKIGFKRDCAEFYYLLGDNLNKLMQYNDALKAVEKGISIKSDNVDLWLLKASILLGMDKKDESEECIKTALKFPATSISSLNSVAWILYKLGNYPNALKYASEAVEKEPNQDYVLDTLACIYYKLGNYPKALELFNKAMELKKNDFRISWSVIIELYEKMGKLDEAKRLKELYEKKEDD